LAPFLDGGTDTPAEATVEIGRQVVHEGWASRRAVELSGRNTSVARFHGALEADPGSTTVGGVLGVLVFSARLRSLFGCGCLGSCQSIQGIDGKFRSLTRGGRHGSEGSRANEFESPKFTHRRGGGPAPAEAPRRLREGRSSGRGGTPSTAFRSDLLEVAGALPRRPPARSTRRSGV